MIVCRASATDMKEALLPYPTPTHLRSVHWRHVYNGTLLIKSDWSIVIWSPPPPLLTAIGSSKIIADGVHDSLCYWLGPSEAQSWPMNSSSGNLQVPYIWARNIYRAEIRSILYIILIYCPSSGNKRVWINLQTYQLNERHWNYRLRLVCDDSTARRRPLLLAER